MTITRQNPVIRMRIQKTNALFRVLLPVALLGAAAASGQEKARPPRASEEPYRNPKLTIEERVADLLPRMTLEEKVDQIAGWNRDTPAIDTTGTYTPEQAQAALRRIFNTEAQLTPRQAAILRNAVQRHLREKTRLGIPALFMGEALHGFMQHGATSFPQALALASTWDPDLVRRVFSAAGEEAGSSGIGQVFTPVLDIARDPRWGRTEETYGEDPFLAARMGVAAVTGLQGPTFMINRRHVMATAKHFAVHGQPEGGTNTAPANFSERIIREEFLVPFEAAVREARVGSVMASYNEIDGIPVHVNRWLLDQVLVQEWGFRGYVTSDGGGLQMLVGTHGVAANSAEAARLALAAGVDFDLSNGSVYRTLLRLVRQGLVPETQLDRAVGRLLAAKFRLGLFENPYVDPAHAERITNCEAHRRLAATAAEKAVVLLKNENNLLPLDLAKIKSIAVIGPNAADVHLGGYSREPAHGVSLLQGIRDRAGTQAEVLYAEGCRITTARQGWRGWYDENVQLIDPKTQAESIQAAVEVARKADVAVLVVGENESTNREAWSETHLGDRDSLELLGAQNELVESVVETGTPTVVFLINGRPLSINFIAERVPAILEGWYLGQEGGTAAARVLFGDVNPGGKLPITFPRSVGNIPAFYYHKPSANRTYAFSTRQPLYPFGFGLSYTAFRFDNLRVEPARIAAGGTAMVSVEVTNTGAREGDEVAQLYVHQKLASVTRPVMLLKGFERITLKPGEKKTVTFRVTPEMLSMLDLDIRRVVEPGVFELMVGPSSAQTTKVTLAVTGVHGETGIPLPPPPPAGSESGLVSDFEDPKKLSNFGTWLAISDREDSGGASTAAMTPVAGGANGSAGALRVTGEVKAGAQFAWAGAVFVPSSSMGEAANLSNKKAIAFWAKGDDQDYAVTVMTESRSGQMPTFKTIRLGPEWKQFSFPLSDFETDGHDVLAFGVARTQSAGKFQFDLDQVEIK
ncbi:MAG: CIA30 family protein [Vicinamibacteria bacterium]|nr:CIA30 family protein [Vicinamibacteria bacterium]